VLQSALFANLFEKSALNQCGKSNQSFEFASKETALSGHGLGISHFGVLAPCYRTSVPACTDSQAGQKNYG
jgi:hypothetical protein